MLGGDKRCEVRHQVTLRVHDQPHRVGSRASMLSSISAVILRSKSRSLSASRAAHVVDQSATRRSAKVVMAVPGFDLRVGMVVGSLVRLLKAVAGGRPATGS
jgi:hypothetical protein